MLGVGTRTTSDESFGGPERTVRLAGRKTSVSVEAEFWKGLRAIADERNITLLDLIVAINKGAAACVNLSSAIRLFVLCLLSQQAGRTPTQRGLERAALDQIEESGLRGSEAGGRRRLAAVIRPSMMDSL